MYKKSLILCALCTAQLMVQAQALSLKQCIDYASANNANMRNAEYDRQIAAYRVREQKGTALPQIDGTATVDDNLLTATTLMPAVLFGGAPDATVPVKMGKQYTAAATVQLNQKLYDPVFWVALKAAKTSTTQADQAAQKVSEQTAYSICRTYYQTIIQEKQYRKLEATLGSSQSSLATLELKYQNGMARKLDVDKLRVSLNNTRAQMQQSQLAYEQSLNELKYKMGMPLDSAIALADTVISIVQASVAVDTAVQNYAEKRIDYQMQKTMIELYQLDKKRHSAGYLPTLSLTGRYGYNAMRDEFDFFDTKKDWYSSAAIGLRLTVPIFDGLQKQARISQSKITVLKAEETLRQTEQNIKLDISNYEKQLANAQENIANETVNLKLAEEVYQTTALMNAQGTGTSLELVQAESALREAQNTYYNRLFSLYIARLDLEQSRGSLMAFISKQ